MPELSSVDFNAMGGVEDQVVITLAECCEKLQGLNIGGCKGVGDAGLKAIAKRNMFRRVSQLLPEVTSDFVKTDLSFPA